MSTLFAGKLQELENQNSGEDCFLSLLLKENVLIK